MLTHCTRISLQKVKMSVSKVITEWYDYAEAKYGDPRTTEYFMMGSPTPLLLTLVSYLFFVTYLGPKLMENRKPYNISNIIKIYNCAQVICNFYLVYMSFELLWFTDSYRYNCLEIDYSDTPLARKRLTLMWLGFMSRLLDLLDTVFFVLRKKFTQVSFLHVYHHLLVVFVGWILAKTLPGGQLAFVGSINSFVHGVMYSYYFLSSCSPQNKWNLWWKKYITQLQLFQFFICIVHSILQLMN
uniref:Elongation of very long chain fatty acids protein n=2 Tax=Cacopsylla melanoneura TaxID=428564 RepID=A0A8D8PU95_9HEMI